MVDNSDLKSDGQNCPCGFESHLRYHLGVLPNDVTLLVLDYFNGEQQRCFSPFFSLA